jgi:hypothetical protein
MNYVHEKKEGRKYAGPRPTFPSFQVEHLPVMHQYIDARKLSFQLAIDNGWYPYASDFDRELRICIPCSNSLNIPYWQGRLIFGHGKRYDSPSASREDSIVIVWPEDGFGVKGSVIVEGPLDALAAAGEGYLGIGLMGNKPNEQVMDFVIESVQHFQPIIIVPDLDTPQMGIDLLHAFRAAALSASLRLPTKKDIAEMTRAERKVLLR